MRATQKFSTSSRTVTAPERSPVSEPSSRTEAVIAALHAKRHAVASVSPQVYESVWDRLVFTLLSSRRSPFHTSSSFSNSICDFIDFHTSFPQTSQPSVFCRAKSSILGMSPISFIILSRTSDGFSECLVLGCRTICLTPVFSR